MKRLVSWLVFLIALVGWDQFLLKPVQFYLKKNDYLALLAELVKPSTPLLWDGDFAVGWLFILATLIIIPLIVLAAASVFRAVLRYVERSEIALSVLETKITVEMLVPDKSKARITRRQKFHANRDGVGAYRYVHTSDYGDVQKKDIVSTATVNGKNIISELHKTKRGKTIEITESYSENLPRSWWATYLPDNLVLMIFKDTSLLDKKIVERTVTMENADEFNCLEPLYQLNVQKTPMRNVYLTFTFFDNSVPAHIRCGIFSENAVSYITPTVEKASGRTTYDVYVKRLYQQILRFEWTN